MLLISFCLRALRKRKESELQLATMSKMSPRATDLRFIVYSTVIEYWRIGCMHYKVRSAQGIRQWPVAPVR
jgi:hypothetical protein